MAAKGREEQRDEHLIEIDHLAQNLRQNVQAINGALGAQRGLIRELSQTVEKSSAKMTFVTGKLSGLLGANGELKRRPAALHAPRALGRAAAPTGPAHPRIVTAQLRVGRV